MTTVETRTLTTEDLKATCQNYPATSDAIRSAIELRHRVGENTYSSYVFDLLASNQKAYVDKYVDA